MDEQFVTIVIADMMVVYILCETLGLSENSSLPIILKFIIFIGLSALSIFLSFTVLESDLYNRTIIKRKFRTFIKGYYSNTERYLVNLDKIVERFLYYEGFRGINPKERTPYPTEKEVYIHFERYLYFSVHSYYEAVTFSNKARALELANQMHSIYDKYLNYLFLFGYIKKEEMQAKISQLSNEIAEYRL